MAPTSSSRRKRRAANSFDNKKKPNHGLKGENRDFGTGCCYEVSTEGFVHSNVSLNDKKRSLLQQLVAPMPVEEFLETAFRKRAVHVPASTNPNRLEAVDDLLLGLDTEQLLQHTSSENVFIWLNSKKDSDSRPSSLIQSIEVSDPDAALALLRTGHSTYCRAPPHAERLLVSNLLHDTGMGCGQYDPSGQSMVSMGRGEVEVFVTNSTDHLTDWHWDFQENFTLQLSGSKEWTLQKGPISHPLRGLTPHYASPDTVEPQLKAARLVRPGLQFGPPLQPVDSETAVTDKADSEHSTGASNTVILKPGDLLYHPAGIWHKVRVLEPGVSINVSLMATNYATIAAQAIQHHLLQDAAWRECIVNSPNAPGGAGSALEKLGSLLQELPAKIQALVELGGAQTILPPVLQESWMSKQSRQQQKRDSMRCEDEGDGSNDSGSLSEARFDDNESDQDESEPIIDADQFDAPDQDCCCKNVADLTRRLETNRLVVNPLASLISQSDITRYYDEREASNGDKDIDGDSSESGSRRRGNFVLNVNFAGNEAHESHVRVQLSTVHTEKEMQGWSENPDQDSLPLPLINCLVYHGYWIWTEKHKKSGGDRNESL